MEWYMRFVALHIPLILGVKVLHICMWRSYHVHEFCLLAQRVIVCLLVYVQSTIIYSYRVPSIVDCSFEDTFPVATALNPNIQQIFCDKQIGN